MGCWQTYQRNKGFFEKPGSGLSQSRASVQTAPWNIIRVKWSNFTVDSKTIRALATILTIFFWFDCQFLSSNACYKLYNA